MEIVIQFPQKKVSELKKGFDEMRKKETEQKKLQTLDLYLSSYLSLCGIYPRLEINNGRVVFVFSATDDLYKLMTNYNSNVNIPVTDFVTAIKALRGQMLTMRGQR